MKRKAEGDQHLAVRLPYNLPTCHAKLIFKTLILSRIRRIRAQQVLSAKNVSFDRPWYVSSCAGGINVEVVWW